MAATSSPGQALAADGVCGQLRYTWGFGDSPNTERMGFRAMAEPTTFGYGDWRFSWGDHICGIFDDHDQQMEVMGPYVATGIMAEQRCIWVAPQASANALSAYLTSADIDVPTLAASAQLVLVSDVDFYLRDGLFSPEHTRELATMLLQDGRRRGYPTMRMATDVSWLQTGAVGHQEWERLEAAVTYEIADKPIVTVCQYDRRQLSGSLIVTALRTHPAVILGTTIRDNPFFVPGAPPGTPERV
jgi:hypothetical protein